MRSILSRRSYVLEWCGMVIYCLFCETAKCNTLAKIAAERFGCRAISPKQVQHTWSKGKSVDIIHDLLPGYLFLYFEDEDDKPTITELWRMHGVIRCLSDSDRNYELKGNDEAFALTLLKSDGVIGKTQVYREGDRIRICDGAFEGLETRIVKVDHRGSRMMIEIPFAKQLVRTWVEYEIVELKE